MVTLKQLAAACGVSTATVSNALNKTGRVSEETANNIIQTSKKMGYVPNVVAKNLKKRINNTIGIITEDFTVFNCTGIVDGINRYLDENGYNLILGNLRLYKRYTNTFYRNENYVSLVEEEFQIMQSKQVRGIIYIGAHGRELNIIPKKLGIPVVVAYSDAVKHGFSSVVLDDEQGAFEATCTLIRLGYKKIGLIQGDIPGSSHARLRYNGYCRALETFGIAYDEDIVVDGDWSSESGYKASKILFDKGVRAIFSMNDTMAAGVYDCATEMKLEIGRDVFLIGFDNLNICGTLRPALSSVVMPLEEIGMKAATLILAEIEQCSQGELYKIPCEVCERNSTRFMQHA